MYQCTMNPDPAKIKDIILNAKQPYVMSNVTPRWDCFQQTFEEWCESFDSLNPTSVLFEGCSIKGGRSPQWERQRSKVMMEMRNICKTNPQDKGRWNSFSYRNIVELPEPCRRGINFEWFGFPEVDEDITFWIGSAQAHTPCHYDTYGCNIVVQVFGRKSWLLLPPETKLSPVRVPFEESSVYCAQNFYSPASYREFVGVEHQVYHVTLEPGMALIVPPRWWHYVETLEPSLNFNSWLPLQNDVDSLLSECITKMLVQDLSNGCSDKIKNHIMNPNEDLQMTNEGLDESYELLNYLLSQKQTNKQRRSNLQRYQSGYLPSDAFNRLVAEYESFIKPVEQMFPCEFFAMINRNSSRHDPAYDGEGYEKLSGDEVEKVARLRNMINVCCSPEVVQMIEHVLLEE